MKEYFVTFCTAFFATVCVCVFNLFGFVPVAVFGGIPLAAVAYWRMSVAGKAGLSLAGHTAAFLLGWFLLFAAVIFPMLGRTMGFLMIYCSWGIAVLSACMIYIFRRRRLAVALSALVVWLLFVSLVIPAWEEAIETFPKCTNGAWIMPWSRV